MIVEHDEGGSGGVDLHSVGGTGLLDAMVRHRWLIALLLINSMALGVLLTVLQPTVYAATAELVLADPRRVDLYGTAAGGATVRSAANQAEMMTSDATLTRAAANLSVPLTTSQLRAAIEVSVGSATDRVRITATRPRAAEAAEMANAVAAAYAEQARADAQERADQVVSQLHARQERERERAAELAPRVDEVVAAGDTSADASLVRADYDAALAAIADLRRLEDEVITDATVFQPVAASTPASVPTAPRERQLRNVAMMAVLGLLGGALVAWWRAERHPIALRPGDVGSAMGPAATGRAVLGSVGTGWRRADATARTLRRTAGALDFAEAQADARVFLLAPVRPGRSVAALTLALGRTIATEGRRVILVDADLDQAPLTTSVIGANQPRPPGLSDLLAGGETLPSLIPVYGQRLRLLGAGRPYEAPEATFRGPAFKQVMADLLEQADLLLVAGTPLAATGDSAALLQAIDGVVPVVTRGTPLADLMEIRNLLAVSGTRIVGTVFDVQRRDLREALTDRRRRRAGRRGSEL